MFSSFLLLTVVDPQNDPHIMLKQFLAIFYKKLTFLRSHWIYLLISVLLLFGGLALSYNTINGSDGGPTVTNRANAVTASLDDFEHTELLLYVQDSKEADFVQFVSVLKTIAQNHNVKIRDWTTGERDELLAIERENIRRYHEQIFGAIHLSFDAGVRVNILFPGNALHSSFRLINLVDNVLARANGDQAQIVTINEPIIKINGRGSSGGDFSLYQALMTLGMFESF